MKHSSLLDTPLFPDEPHFVAFKELLATLDHITPQQIPRESYIARWGNILEKTGNDKFWDTYKLYLPEDLRHWEVLEIISLLHSTFHLEKFWTTLDPLIAQTKLSLVALLKSNPELPPETFISEMVSTYRISEAVKKRIEEYQPKPGELRAFVSNFYLPRDEREKQVEKGYIYYPTYKTEQIETELATTFSQTFDKTFLRKGIDMVRYGLETITKAEQDVIIAYCEENRFEKIRWNWQITYTKWGEVYTIRNVNIDEESQKLREVMDIEYWKEKLHRVRERKNDQSIAEMETAATNAIFKALKQYPYQYDKKNNGYQLSKILETKEIYCVGFSLLGHTFLDELQIKHKGLNIINHSALKVEIGNNLYFFDAASYDDRILPFKRWAMVGQYTYIEGLWRSSNTPMLAQEGDAETILLSQIYYNKGHALERLGQYEEAIICYDKVLECNPSSDFVYNNKGNVLHKLGKYEEAIICYEESLRLDPNDDSDYYNKGNALRELGTYEEAIICYDEALRLNPNSDSAYNNKGNALGKLGKYEEAIICYDEALRLNPNNDATYNNKQLTLKKLYPNFFKRLRKRYKI